MKKRLIALFLSLVFFSGLCGQLSPNGYQFQHDWQYYSNFSQTNNGGYTQIDHINIQMNGSGNIITPATVQVNADNVVIYTDINLGIGSGTYILKFWVSKQIDGEYVNQGSYITQFPYLNQTNTNTFTVPAVGNGSFALSFDLYNLPGQHIRSGYHVFEKTNSSQQVLINPNLDVLFKLRSSSSNLKRPMLLVEGYDPLNSQSFDYYSDKILQIESCNEGVFNDVDLYLLNFNDATIDLRENSMVVLAAIKYINTLYQPEMFMEGISVLGFSMGGVISRYALAYAEEHGIPHNCTQLISYDSPHRGAVINTNVQNELYNLYDIIDSLQDAISTIEWASCVFGLAGELVVNLALSDFNNNLSRYKAMLHPILRALESPASKQLLRYDVNSDEYLDELIGSIDYRNFYSEINEEDRLAYLPNTVNGVLNKDENDPNNKPGYPYKQNAIKSIAISNGCITKSGDIYDSFNNICTFNLPSIMGDVNIQEQGWDTQPGSTLGMEFWAGSASGNLYINYDPVFVPLKSSLHLRPEGANGFPDNACLVMNIYDDIVPRDNLNNIITDYQEITNYLSSHSLFDTVVLSNEANLLHADISDFVVTNAVSKFMNPFNRAIGTISGNITNTDLTGIEMKVYIGDSEQQLSQDFYKLNPDGSWVVAYTLLRDMDLKIKFSKPGSLPTIKKYHIEYDNTSYSINSIDNQQVSLKDFNLQNIIVSQTNYGSFEEINDGLRFITEYFSENGYNNEAIMIKVYPGTYTESVDLSSIAALGITNFTLEGVGNAIINGDGYGIKLVVDEDSSCNGAVYNINNLKIADSDRGILYRDYGDGLSENMLTPQLILKIYNCTIYDCGSSSYFGTSNLIFSAAAIHFEGAGSITNCHLHDNVMTTFSDTYSQYCQAGGLYVNNNTSSQTKITYNIFTHNTGALSGGLVAKGKGNILISNNKFSGNTRSLYCDIDNAYETNALSVYDASNIMIKNNLFVDNLQSTIPYGLVVGLTTYLTQAASPIKFLSNTIVNTPLYDNNGLGAISFRINAGISVQDIQIRNNIISSTNNNGCIIGSGGGYYPLSIDHNILHNISLIGFNANLYDPEDPNSVYNPTEPRFNYQCDPQLDANYIPRWDATTMSHCIDTGTGENDSDGTPPDIGAFPAATHAFWDYTFRKSSADAQPNERGDTYHWVCYPVVNSLTQGKTVARSFFHELLGTHENANSDVVADVLQEILWYERNVPKYIVWNGANWGPDIDTHSVVSPQGYKIKLLPLSDPIPVHYPPVALHHSGFLTPENTPFMIYGCSSNGGQTYENWIGYFDTESVWPTDAFASIWNDITMIKAKDWCLYRDPNSGIGALIGKMLSLNCGDMVIVTTVNDHNFQWDTTIPIDPKKKESPTAFEYVEKADYTPVYIDLSAIDLSNLKEIGLKLDGICKGAVVVTDSLEQICAYLDEGESLSSGLVELVFFYESKSQPLEMRSVAINDKQLSSSIIGNDPAYPVYNIKVTNADLSNTVVPVLSMEQNYPNPFNPTTTIRYTINEPGSVSLDIFNVKGQLVKTLYHGNAEVGGHIAIWNGLDNSGNACSSGVYFYRLRTPKTDLVRKMLMLK